VPGLWERWEKGEEPIESCTLITTGADGVVDQTRDRMPVIPMADDFDRWLDPSKQDASMLQS
jgi:putative SOS response-associated peptidase YedK